MNQSYRDFNVVVSDDCSPEDLKSIVEKFDDDRLTYRRNESNFGLEHLVDHWNMLVEMTEADYIILASDDDIYAPNYLEQIDNLTQQYPYANVFRPLIRHIDQNDALIRDEKPTGKEFYDISNYLDVFIRGELFSGVQQFVFRRKALIETGGFVHFPAAWFSDDASVYSLARGGIAIVNNTLFSMRYSGISISSNSHSRQIIWCKVKAAVKYIKFLRYNCRDYISSRQIRMLTLRVKSVTFGVLMGADFGTFLFCILYPMVVMPLTFNIRWGTECLCSYIKRKTYHEFD